MTMFKNYNVWGHKGLTIEIPPDVFPDAAWLKRQDALCDHPEHGFFASCYKNKKLHYRKNLPPVGTRINGIVVWQHGINSQSGQAMQRSFDGCYTDMALRIRLMNAQGIAVYAHDQLGHGFSEGTRGYIPQGNWKINRDDFIQFAKLAASEHEEGTPLFVSGDSYGGCIALHAAHAFQEQPSLAPKGFIGFAVTCPAIEGDLPPTLVLLLLRYGLAPWFPEWTPFFMPHPITPERIWKEVEARTYYTNQEEMHGLSVGGSPFCLGTAVGLLGALQTAQSLISTVGVPFHINHGSDDFGVPLSGSERLMEQSQTAASDKVLNIVQGGYHALYSELNAEDTVNDEIQWIQTMIQRRGDKK